MRKWVIRTHDGEDYRTEALTPESAVLQALRARFASPIWTAIEIPATVTVNAEDLEEALRVLRMSAELATKNIRSKDEQEAFILSIGLRGEIPKAGYYDRLRVALEAAR